MFYMTYRFNKTAKAAETFKKVRENLQTDIQTSSWLTPDEKKVAGAILSDSIRTQAHLAPAYFKLCDATKPIFGTLRLFIPGTKAYRRRKRTVQLLDRFEHSRVALTFLKRTLLEVDKKTQDGPFKIKQPSVKDNDQTHKTLQKHLSRAVHDDSQFRYQASISALKARQAQIIKQQARSAKAEHSKSRKANDLGALSAFANRF